MSSYVTSTYIGSGTNAGDVMITVTEAALPLPSTPDRIKFAETIVANCFQWQVVSTVGAVTVEITYDLVNWFQIAMQDMTSTGATTYVTTTTANKPCCYYGPLRGIRVKQSGVTAATAQLMGWSYGLFG